MTDPARDPPVPTPPAIASPAEVGWLRSRYEVGALWTRRGRVERYLGLESFEITEELLDLCGATLDQRALPVLKRRLQEEEGRLIRLQRQGYVRMAEKSQQLMSSLTPLIAALEGKTHDQPG